MEAASKLVKQRSMEALNSIRLDTTKLVMVTVTGDSSTGPPSRRSSASSNIVHGVQSRKSSPMVKIKNEKTSRCSSPVPILATSDDAVVIDAAAKFVQDIIDKAKNEASSKLNHETLELIGLAEPTFQCYLDSRGVKMQPLSQNVVPNQYDMLIKKNFAKYVIDNKAKVVPRNSSLDNEKQKVIVAPAFHCSVLGVQRCLKERVSIKTIEGGSDVAYVKLDISIIQDNRNVAFAIVFEESLLQFLPQDIAKYEKIFVSFASTAVDNFLFVQFFETNLQIRTLLVSRETDLLRILKEKSFYALPLPLPQSWIRAINFQLGVFSPKNVNPDTQPYVKKEEFKLLLVKFRNQEKKVCFSKENYLTFEIILDGIKFDLFFHQSSAEKISFLREQNYLKSTKQDNGYSVERPNGELLFLRELVNNLEEIPKTILTCTSFIIEKSNSEFLNERGLSVTRLDSVPAPKQQQVAIQCPFPQCDTSIQPEAENYAAISHFLTHADFKRVVEGQVRRHQERKGVTSSQCPFDNCSFTNWNWFEMERHYAGQHRVGHIVFLQFSKANKWEAVMGSLVTEAVMALVQCSHCYEVMTRQQLALHIQELRAGQR